MTKNLFGVSWRVHLIDARQVRMSRSRFPWIALAALAIFTSVAELSLGQSPDCLGTTSSDNPASRNEIDQGVEAYKNARYAEAISHFDKATNLAPCLIMARVYLATAQAQNVVPGLNTPDNMKIAEEVIANFQLALAQSPHDVNSLKQVAAIYLSTKKLDEAREWQKKVLAEDPHDAEAAYSIGVIDWTKAHLNVLNALTAVALNDDGEGNTQVAPEVLAAIKQQNTDLIAEAMQYLAQAIADRPNYADATAYMNLVYRRKADTDYDNPMLRNEDILLAKEWGKKAMQTRKQDEERKNAEPLSPRTE